MNDNKTVEIRYYTGYIRNYKSLCSELGVNPSVGREQRERELLTAAFLKWRAELTEHIYGMFALAIWDVEAKKLFLFRDQVGQKHLFYTVINGELYYSGDINELASANGFEKKLNVRTLQRYLFFGYPIGEETFYENVYKLMPGHYAVWDGSKVSVHRYFLPTFEPDRSKTADEWAEEIKRVIDEILSEERSDDKVPYKESFLSGGVDSSYLFAASDAACANTVGYGEAGFDESSLARQTAEALGKEIRVKVITPEEYFERIPEVIDKMGQPLGDASAVAFSLGCKAVKEHADVVYSGEGIDEFFGGYNAHKTPLGEGWVYFTCSHLMNEPYVKELMKNYDSSVDLTEHVKKLWSMVEGQDELSKKLTIDISLWLEGDIYLNTDRTSTACGIELHTPFSDLRLLNVARKIPSEYKLTDEFNKYAFRKAAASVLPDEVAFRKKVGFPVPIREWLRNGEYNKPIEEKLFGKTSEKFFNQKLLHELWELYLGGDDRFWGRVYAIYAFLLWYDLKF